MTVPTYAVERFRKNLWYYRGEQGIPHRVFSALCGWYSSKAIKLETGVTQPTLQDAIDASEALLVPLEVLLAEPTAVPFDPRTRYPAAYAARERQLADIHAQRYTRPTSWLSAQTPGVRSRSVLRKRGNRL